MTAGAVELLITKPDKIDQAILATIMQRGNRMKRFVQIMIVGSVMIAGSAWGATYTVCDSGCDQTSIADALTAYDLGADDIVDIQDDQALSSTVTVNNGDSGTSGQPVIFTSTNGSTITGPDSNAAFFLNDADYIKFSNLSMAAHANGSTRGISITQAAGTTSSLEVDNCTFTNFSQGGVSWLVTGTNASIVNSPSVTNSTFTACGSSPSYGAISFRSEDDAPNAVLTDATITGNTFTNSPYLDIYLFGEGVFATYGWSGGVVIQDNTSSGSVFGSIKVGAFAAADWGTNLISGNYVTGSQGANGGINVFYNQYLSIYDNEIEDGTSDGIDGNGILVDQGNQYVRVYQNEINRMTGNAGEEGSGFGVMILDAQYVDVYRNVGTGNKGGFYQGDTGDITVTDIDYYQ